METTTQANRTLPCVLVVEDDPVSALFLQQALLALPAQVDIAQTAAIARARVAEVRYDIWMIDAHLPDGSGADLLGGLRRIDATSIALAHTASREADAAEALLSAGFTEVLVKPLLATEVRTAARRALGMTIPVREQAGTTGAPGVVWDDEAAKRALFGSSRHIGALRALFAADLPRMRQRVVLAVLDGNPRHLHDELHRLRASCAFVGAARLAIAAQRLYDDLHCMERLQEFESAVQATLAEKPDVALTA